MTSRFAIAAAAAFACALLAAFPARAEERRLTVQGEARDYSVHIPAAAPAGPLPLVIVLHGGMGSGAQAEQAYGWPGTADANGFMAAFPDGQRRSWNAGGGCCGPAREDSIDDVAFLDALIADLIARGEADPDRIYVAGISNGAAMAYRYACEGAHPVAAVGAVAGAMTLDCPAPPPVSLMAIHGMQDRTIPFAGGQGRRARIVDIDWPPMEETLRAFRAAAGCGDPTVAEEGAVQATRWTCADGRAVELLAIADAGHQWPGAGNGRPLASLLLDLDPPSRALDATAALWDFFSTKTR